MRIAVVGNGRSVHAVSRSVAVAARGHEVRLVTLGPVWPAAGIEVCTRPLPRGPIDAARAARGFLEDIRSFRPDVLHLHYAGGRLGTAALLSEVRPLVVTVMGGDVLPEQHPEGRMAPAERRATRRILESADVILVKSDALRPAVAAFGDFLPKVETVRWGVDPGTFHGDDGAASEARARLGLAPVDRVILSPRILAPLYNQHLIVEALPAILTRVPEAVLLVTEYNAQGDYRRAVEARARALGVFDRVRFIGEVAPSAMPGLYSLAEVAVSVPSSDGLPQSLFEAMACETPVVLGRLGAYAEVVADGESAVVADFTADSIAAAVLRLLEDGGFRRKVAAAALARVREIALLPREVDRVLAIYERSRVGPRRRPRAGRFLDAVGLLLR